jgi:hypothetical protein
MFIREIPRLKRTVLQTRNYKKSGKKTHVLRICGQEIQLVNCINKEELEVCTIVWADMAPEGENIYLYAILKILPMFISVGQ